MSERISDTTHTGSLWARHHRRFVWRLATIASVCLVSPSASALRPPPPAVTKPTELTDGEISRAVIQELRADRHLVASAVTVTSTRGIVELRGSVQGSGAHTRAGRVAGVVRGVRAVIDRLHVDVAHRRDAQVAKDVRAALRDSAVLARMPIRVRVRRGVVDLWGGITSWDEQRLAERVVNSVSGVRFCQDQLSWDPTIVRTPALLEADVRARLDWDPLVDHDTIDVHAAGTRITLSGTVGSANELTRAISLSWVKGVTEVQASALVIDDVHRPDPNVRLSKPSDAEIAGTIHDLATLWPLLPLATPAYSVSSGEVTVTGTVPTSADNMAIEGLLAGVVGVVAVHNNLRGPWWQPPHDASPNDSRRRPFRR